MTESNQKQLAVLTIMSLLTLAEPNPKKTPTQPKKSALFNNPISSQSRIPAGNRPKTKRSFGR